MLQPDSEEKLNPAPGASTDHAQTKKDFIIKRIFYTNLTGQSRVLSKMVKIPKMKK
jgi:hypothetical protein